MNSACVDCGSDNIYCSNRCNKCYQKHRYGNLPEVRNSILVSNKKWREKNIVRYREMRRISSERWRDKHREEYNAYHREYRRKRRENAKQISKEMPIM